jgi:hypothetical protein
VKNSSTRRKHTEENTQKNSVGWVICM